MPLHFLISFLCSVYEEMLFSVVFFYWFFLLLLLFFISLYISCNLTLTSLELNITILSRYQFSNTILCHDNFTLFSFFVFYICHKICKYCVNTKRAGLKLSADDNLKYFSYFFQKIDFDISFQLSWKVGAYFLGKIRKRCQKSVVHWIIVW